ncbi:hypothetical protein EOPP23_10745 [Endozoicomonas sp. OPT23]|uniref:ExeM/NucH family extracellular endonuclease n=1 Tax=Endozoicomonas sp. OPT23 TaxID=2072845 RepID=UPI00129B2FB2|nr:ExeM/NucH family extracellular endonuclease [Endozoicomonas sp. OPT23]MRI33463.1 hypothetical protein [Endozoicomonas sp. OPT23]
MTIKRLTAALGSLTLSFLIGFSPNALSAPKTIQQVRGDSSLKGKDVTLEGVVTHITADSRGKSGYYLQDGTSTSPTSSAIYVYEKGTKVTKGNTVEVKGKLGEYKNQLQITGSVTSTDKGAGSLPTAVVLQASETGYSGADLEKMEGMLVSAQGYTLSKAYSFDYGRKKNNLFVADSVQFKSTQLYPGGKAAEDHAAKNKARRLAVIESGKTRSGEINYYAAFNYWANYLRVGSKLGDFKAIVSQRDSSYELLVDSDWAPDSVTLPAGKLARPTASSIPDRQQISDLRLASFNLLNWFTDDVIEGAPESPGNRGAKSVEDGLLQLEKLTSAIRLMDADVLGLLEVGNNGSGDKSAIGFLVSSLNLLEADETRRYQFVYPKNASQIGTDAISVGLIYRPVRVTPKGEVETLEMPREVSGSNDVVGMRESLIQEFCLKGQPGKCLTIAVSHFKSKRCSGCADDPKGGPDEQGCCTRLRSTAANVLGKRLQAEAQSGDVLLLGDFNAYAKEDPVRILTEDTISPAIVTSSRAFFVSGKPLEQSEQITKGFSYKPLTPVPNPLPAEGQYAEKIPFSYSYNGELGNLDHGLVSVSLHGKMRQADDLHINSLESPLFEYSGRYTGGSEYKGGLMKSSGELSSSDHDAVWGDFRL